MQLHDEIFHAISMLHRSPLDYMNTILFTRKYYKCAKERDVSNYGMRIRFRTLTIQYTANFGDDLQLHAPFCCTQLCTKRDGKLAEIGVTLREYPPSDPPLLQIYICGILPFVDNKRHGKQSRYRYDGRIYMHGLCANNLSHGFSVRYYEEGGGKMLYEHHHGKFIGAKSYDIDDPIELPAGVSQLDSEKCRLQRKLVTDY